MLWGFPGGTSGKEPGYQCRRTKTHWFDPWVGKIPWRRKWLPTAVFLPGKPHGQRSLISYSPWVHKELDTTKVTQHSTVLLGLLLCSWMWGTFFGGIQHSPVNGCSAASCKFGLVAEEDECTPFYFAILNVLYSGADFHSWSCGECFAREVPVPLKARRWCRG